MRMKLELNVERDPDYREEAVLRPELPLTSAPELLSANALISLSRESSGTAELTASMGALEVLAIAAFAADAPEKEDEKEDEEDVPPPPPRSKPTQTSHNSNSSA